MKPEDIEISDVHYRQDGGYAVTAKAKYGKNEATFRVDLSKRRQRNPYSPNKKYRHHRKPFEDIEAETRESVLAMCRQVVEALSRSATQYNAPAKRDSA